MKHAVIPAPSAHNPTDISLRLNGVLQLHRMLRMQLCDVSTGPVDLGEAAIAIEQLLESVDSDLRCYASSLSSKAFARWERKAEQRRAADVHSEDSEGAPN